MEALTRLTENWLTRKPKPQALEQSLFIVFVLFVASFFFWTGLFQADDWMPASAYQVFHEHQYWRLWTGLFAHGDAGHLLSNTFLFLPFSYFLLGYFSPLLFPFLGIAMGGVINFLVLKEMPEHTSLIGISGVVYWMGAVWLSLYLLIDRRESLRRRVAKVLFISMVLFVPETYKPETSYLSHFVGYFLGVLSAIAFYALKRREFLAAEVYEKIEEEEDSWFQPKADLLAEPKADLLAEPKADLLAEPKADLEHEHRPQHHQDSYHGQSPDRASDSGNPGGIERDVNDSGVEIKLCADSGKHCQAL
jgi:rhomboid protease GluP